MPSPDASRRRVSPSPRSAFLSAVSVAGLLLAACAWACAHSPPPAAPSEISRAHALAEELVQAKQLPGFSIAVARDGKLVWSEGFGFADVEQQVPVTPLTRFRVGSVSKVLTAAAVARLVEDGALDLDAPVQRYVPGFPAKPWPFTTRQLAGHIAGIRHYQEKDFGLLKAQPHYDTVNAGLVLFQEDPLLFEPGTDYRYSSYGWNLISAVVEGASRQEFLHYMQASIFEPLGLQGTVADQAEQLIPHRTRFYARDASGALRHAPYVDNSYKWAGGGFLSTAEDLVRFGSAHLQPGFLRQASLDVLFKTQQLNSGKETGVGIGWRMGVDAKGRRILHHGGTIEGGRAMLMLFPESRVVVALLANTLANFNEADAQRIGDVFIASPNGSSP
ncbi:serine hydrolase [Stigmatella sp. ncwal1]|uniref:Serine hydrolase n=1 Tax=Stigmatella ashevillensis TaxID=2995309 RepID=A0ABT5DHC9_9BACT|nr:serine hydrolase domain-containing protein [Stigmatella ashevillena]MDC0713018.1 serine hydrolase [Stigmatella ashevillena]